MVCSYSTCFLTIRERRRKKHFSVVCYGICVKERGMEEKKYHGVDSRAIIGDRNREKFCE